MKITERRLRQIIKSVIKENSMQGTSTMQALIELQRIYKDSTSEMASFICGNQCPEQKLNAIGAILSTYTSEQTPPGANYDEYEVGMLILDENAPIEFLATAIDAIMKHY